MAVTYINPSPLIEAARKSLPDLEREMHEAFRVWQHKKDLWEAAKSIIESDDRQRGKQPSHNAQAAAFHVQQNLTLSGRVPKGLVYQHVDAVLTEGKSYTQQALKVEMSKRFKVEHSNTSVYRALGKGKSEKRYKLEGNLWSKV
jgi:hypothetical protein